MATRKKQPTKRTAVKRAAVKRPAAKKKMGQPPKDIDVQRLERLAKIHCTMDEIAYALGVGRSTLFEHVRRNPETAEALERGRAEGRRCLRRVQWDLLTGKTTERTKVSMAVWLGKQLLGQTDKIEQKHAYPRPAELTDEQLRRIAAGEPMAEVLAASETTTTVN
jgi:hypothetical protein